MASKKPEATGEVDPDIKDLKIRVVNTHKKLRLMIQDLEAQAVFSLDTETDNLNALIATLEAISISTDEHNYVIPFKYIDSCLLRSEVLKALEPLFETKKVYMWNAKYDLHVLINYGYVVKGYIDAMGMAHTFDSDDFNALDHRAKKVLGWGKTGKFREVKKRLLKTGDPTEFFLYAARDAQATYFLGEFYRQMLKDNDLWGVFYHQENRVIREFLKMERHGIDVDTEYMKEAHELVTKQQEKLDKELLVLAGKTLNYNSRKQLAELIFGDFQMPVQRLSGKTGDPSTDKETLEFLADFTFSQKHRKSPQVLKGKKFCKLLLAYRKVEKLRSTYTDLNSPRGMMAKLTDENRLHGSFNPFGTSTGRVSSSNPNMQNITRNPKRDLDEDGKSNGRYIMDRFPDKVYLRDAFTCPDGMSLIGVDYSQIELRLIAHFSQCPVMLDVYHNNGDIHETTRMGCNLAEGEDGRVDAKRANFGLHYGMGSKAFAKLVNKSEQWAKHFIENYWDLYCAVQDWRETLVNYCREAGEIRCITGRRRLLPGIDSSNYKISGPAERICINTAIQGGAADLIKNAMINLGDNKDLSKLKVRMLLQVHDELIFRCPEKSVQDALPIIQGIMEKPVVPLTVPLIAKPQAGNCWGNIH